jgi:hypothetical protein
MKKVLVLLLLFIVACGGTSEESSVEDTTTTTVQDTTTTTIPPAPTSDTNYVELYNSKLGTELCSDAKEIDTTTEECLRQYKENLNYLITLQNEIGDFASDLISYYETYPELINQEYENYINFVENEYSQVFTTVSTVEAKYVERFGGVPTVSLPIFSNTENLSVNCTVNGKFDYSENLKSAELTYINNTGEIISFNTNDLQGFSKLLKNTGGTFSLFQSKFTNHLDETFEQSNNLENSFFIEHLFHRISKIELPDSISKGQSFQIKIYIEPVQNVQIDIVRITMLDPLTNSFDDGTTMATNKIENNVAVINAIYLSEPKQFPNWINYDSNLAEVYFYDDSGDYKLGIIDINSIGSNRYNGYYYNSKDASNGLSMPLASRCGQLDQHQINPLNYNELLLKINK